MGSEVSRSQTIVVSRWLVMPMQAMSSPVRSALATASAATDDWVYQISDGSCSTQPGRGNSCSKGFCADATTVPSWFRIIARDEVVPWSRARTYLRVISVVMIQSDLNMERSSRKPGLRRACAAGRSPVCYFSRYPSARRVNSRTCSCCQRSSRPSSCAMRRAAAGAIAIAARASNNNILSRRASTSSTV